MEEIEIQAYLLLKKDGEDGPDVKGGQLDALIVHASKVQKVTESGKSVMRAEHLPWHLTRLASIPFCKLFAT